MTVDIPPQRSMSGSVPTDQEINVYRIIQEALNNVVKHSGATRAAMKINA